MCSVLDNSAHNGRPITRQIAAPITGSDGKPKRRKGGVIVRDPDTLINNPRARYVQRLTDHDAARFIKEVRHFQRILRQARDRDVNESDTVTIIADMLERIFGFDKYTEVTSELAIRGTFCDLAVKIDDAVQYLIEVKAIGLQLKDTHLRQAVNYGANHGVPWVALTNGVDWEIYRV